eukprot:GHVS01053800.1.p1 GENE.GHVS01053800.1~~GHVS01053800.1.p1  ORF type:complete len:111 (-),score=13.24 GHVS01053800.1:184-516(-)
MKRRPPVGVDVVVNVYELSDMRVCCCGFYHTGVEMAGVEYSFASGSGIYESTPRTFAEGRLVGRLVMGQSEVMLSQLSSVLGKLRETFRPDNYDLLANNCNHFCDSLCTR